MTSPRTILGPLTTTFTPPGYCVNVVVQCPYGCNLGWQAQECVRDGRSTYQAQDATSCWPTPTPSAHVPEPPFTGWGFYSPGLVCPSGYVTACSATAGGSSGWVQEYTMMSGETAVGCCPTGFVCGDAYDAQTCSSIARSGASLPVVTCSDGSSQGYSYLTLPATATATDVSSSSSRVADYVVSEFEVFAPMIELRWQSSDLKTTSPAHATDGANSVSSKAADSGSGGLSTGTTTAIGVGLPVAVIATLVAIFFFLRRKKRTADSKEWPDPSSTTTYRIADSHHAAETLDMSSYNKTTDDAFEVLNPPPTELDASSAAQELDTAKHNHSNR